MTKVEFTVNGQRMVGEAGSNLLETLRKNGVKVPSLCHDPRLEPFGACRQCLVEVEGARGAVPACGAKVQAGMIVQTDSQKITSLRRLGLELLISEHCGDCVAPCQLACPAGIDIQGFIAHIANGQYREAVKLIREKLPLPASVGRVCPRFCEAECRRNLVDGPVDICGLKRFAGDMELQSGDWQIPMPRPDTGKKVAVVGGGPAGLTAAYFLALEGHRVSIFEANPKLGGMMRYGIPEYRLPKEILDGEIGLITSICENIFCDKALGRDFTLLQLQQLGFQAVFVALGSWSNQNLGISGEELEGVYSGIGFLGDVALGRKVTVGQRVAVIGGGNTAMDAARTAVRLGADQVTVVYRRSRDEMPASCIEIDQAEEEGVQFQLLTAPLTFGGEEGKVTAINCQKMQLGEPDKSGRRRPTPVKGSEFRLEVDMVITATGQKLDTASLKGSPEISLDKRDNVAVDAYTLQSTSPWIFAGGDCVTGPATVVQAVAAGRQAALSIKAYLQGEEVAPPAKPFNCSRGSLEEVDGPEFTEKEKIPRCVMPIIEPAARKSNFKEFELGFRPETAQRETERCLSCGCQDVFSCRLREYATQLKVQPEKLGMGKKVYSLSGEHPYIVRDANKCVLCGNCVRVCQEVQGIGALGFVYRGSETVVEPALKSPLSETLCNSCGQCINICPTGAISRRSALPKQGPWKVEKVTTVCPHCNIGCQLEINLAGERIVGITSKVDSNTVNEGNLCMKGSFDYTYIQSPGRLRQPLVKIDGKLQPGGWEKALAEAGKILGQVRDTKGLDSIGVLVSPKLSNEDNYLAYKLARTALGTTNVFSTVPVPQIPNPATFADLRESDLIMVLDRDISSDYPIMTHKIKQATARGSKLIMLRPHATRLDSLATLTLQVKRQRLAALLEALIAYVVQYNLVAKQGEQVTDLVDALTQRIKQDFFQMVGSFWVKPDKIIQFLHLYLRAKNPVIIIDGAAISPSEAELLRQFATITGNYGRPGSGVIALYPDCNQQGQIQLGINTSAADYNQLLAEVQARKVTGLLILGDGAQPDSRLFESAAKTVLITPSLSKAVPADIILPGTTLAESAGSITNCEGRLQSVTPALSPCGGPANWEILLGLAQKLNCALDYASIAQIHREVINMILA